MIRPFVFPTPTDFQQFFNSHPRTDEGLTYVTVDGRGYRVDHWQSRVQPATAQERHEMERLLPSYGHIQQGREEEAARLTTLLPHRGGPQIPPPTTTLYPVTIARPETSQEIHLNELATRTNPIPAYEIGPVWNQYNSPMATNVQIDRSLRADTNPEGYYTALNTISHQPGYLYTLTSGINPQGSMHRTEGFWMATQQLDARQIIDLQSPSASSQGAASYIMPYYPIHEGELSRFGVMEVRNIRTNRNADAEEMFFQVLNTHTGVKSELSICNFLWNTQGLVTPEALYDIASLLRSGGNAMVVSDDGYTRNGLAVAAEILLDKIINNEVTDHNRSNVLDDVILMVRQELGPNIVTTPEQLQLLDNFITFVLNKNDAARP